MKKINFVLIFLIGAVIIIANACGTPDSSVTGWIYNDPDNGGFQVADYIEQETGPGLILIEGGRFTMGGTEQDIVMDWDNIERTVSVPSFYLDETEVANIHYLEYLYWVKRVFYADYPEVYFTAMPDTLVWRRDGSYNEPYVEHYLRHPAYHFYPVVGVSWVQASDFCIWRTDRVNEMILIREGILRTNPDQVNEDNFSTDAYLFGQYEGLVRSDLEDLNPNRDTRKVKMEDGIFLPKYRLPTEAEWEFAAFALIGNNIPGSELAKDKRIYPWNGHSLRKFEDIVRGQFMANFVRGQGDFAGVAGFLNDNAFVTAPVKSYWPNDYGLYNMAGNVNEWVMDAYRPLSGEDKQEFNPFRGNIYQTAKYEADGTFSEKDSLGRMKYMPDTSNYPKGTDVRGFGDKLVDELNPEKDGQTKRTSYYNPIQKQITGRQQYATLVNDNARIFKGGSWRDRAYYITPGSRRYLDQDESKDDIGFRCSMARVGAPNGMGESGHDKK